MSDYNRLQDYLFAEKALFDKTVTRNPAMSLKEKQAAWERFLARMQPTAARVQAIDSAREYDKRFQEAQAFENTNKVTLRRLAAS